jgi:hypothetical protein
MYLNPPLLRTCPGIISEIVGNPMSVACDGAAVMLGRKSGVAKLLKDEFPSAIVWHCANHRLELSVADTVKVVAGINRFKVFMDKLYAIYHASPKDSRELHEVLSCWRFNTENWNNFKHSVGGI